MCFFRLNHALHLALASALVSGVAMTATAAMADSFPSSPITWVVNWPAGGGQDTTSRLVADKLSDVLGVAVAVENHTGAGGLAGMRVIARSDPDGYTIGMLGASSVVQQYTHEDAVMLDQLSVLSFFGPDPGALTVNAGFEAETLEEYIELAREAPQSVLNGNDPPGGASYINAAVMESILGIELAKVPYEGYAPTVTALLAGEVNSATVPVPQVADYHEAGQMRILGVMADERHFMAEDVPTFQEQGYDVIMGDFRAIVGPAGIAEDRVKVLADALQQVMSDPEFIERANRAGYIVQARTPEETRDYIRRYDEQVYPVLEEAGLVEFPRQ
jgi:tripartite-type tricarboxylate transporter receptor subunit TctC